MAGIGIQLNRIFNKQTVMASFHGVAFSVVYTIGPLLIVMGCLLLMYQVLGFNTVGYIERELFACSVIYIFIFSLLITAPFNSVLSKYMTDRVYLDCFDDIRPATYVGIIMNLTLSSLVAIPFYLRVLIVGKVPAYYVFTCYMGYLSLSLVLAAMIYNLIMKHYKNMSKYFFLGMAVAFLLSLVFRRLLHFSISYSMLLSLTIGFMLIAVLEFANILRYFQGNSFNYRGPLAYFKRYWQLGVANFFYIFGLFAHNFVFWTVPWNLVIVNCYVCNQPYDMASAFAMFTNITAAVLFITNTEMRFFGYYAEYTNAVIGGKLDRIEMAKNRMFRALVGQLVSLVQIQFIISIVIFLLAIILLPIYGFAGATMQIYPLLAVGYFISYAMYSGILFLQYLNDLNGLVPSSLIFATVSLVGSLPATRLPLIWSGSGFTLAAFLAFTFIFFRLRWLEKNLDSHIFCRGRILPRGEGEMPPAEVFRRTDQNAQVI